MMLIIQHFLEKVILIHRIIDEKDETINEFNGRRLIDCLFLLNEKYELSKTTIRIAWVQGKDILSYKQISQLSNVELNPLEIRFFSNIVNNKRNLNLGISYFDSPALRNYSRDITYTTWYCSEQVGILYSDIIDWKKLAKINFKYFQEFLLILSFDLYRSGGLVISDPALNGLSKQISSREFDKVIDYKFLAARGTLRQKIFYFLNFPSLLKFRCLISDKSVSVYLNTEKILNYYKILGKPNGDLPTYDVVIPTIGRSRFLKDVLEDLNNQSHHPQNVIIIEQIMDIESKTELDYIEDGKYQFQIIHKLINQPGACNARNIALDLVESEWVFFADDDIRINPKLCEEVLFRVINFKIQAITVAAYQSNEKIINSDVIRVWDTFGTCSSFVKSSLIRQIRFDMALEFGYGEDVDFGISIREKGLTIFYGTFTSLLHLKAPIGGFRYKHKFPWSSAILKPKPSPTILYQMYKNSSMIQIKGYKLYLMINQIIKNPLNIFGFYIKWELSKKWAFNLGTKKKNNK